MLDKIKKIIADLECPMCLGEEDPKELARRYKKMSSVTANPPCRKHKTIKEARAAKGLPIFDDYFRTQTKVPL